MSQFDLISRAIQRVAEDKIRAAAEEGAFDNLPGHGKPIPGLQPDRPDAPDWWLRQWVQRESLQDAARGGALKKMLAERKANPTP